MSVRVYVSLKKERKNLAKYPTCVTVFVFVKDCELFDRNFQGRCGLDGGDIANTQAMVLSVLFVSDVILFQINQKKIMV